MSIHAYSLGTSIASLLEESECLNPNIVKKLIKALKQTGRTELVNDFRRAFKGTTPNGNDSPLSKRTMAKVKMAHLIAGIKTNSEIEKRWIQVHTYRSGVARGGATTNWYYSHYKNACRKAGVEPLQPHWNKH